MGTIVIMETIYKEKTGGEIKFYNSFLRTNPQIRGSGVTKAEAVFELLKCHQLETGITIEEHPPEEREVR